MCEAAKTIPTGTSLANITSSNENVILAKDIPEITSSNFMLSVWFYIDNWGQYISREKNILYVANSPNSLTAPGLPENLSGLSTMVKIPSPTANVVILPKNINIALDKFENNLFLIDNEHLVYFGIMNSWLKEKIPADNIIEKTIDKISN